MGSYLWKALEKSDSKLLLVNSHASLVLCRLCVASIAMISSAIWLKSGDVPQHWTGQLFYEQIIIAEKLEVVYTCYILPLDIRNYVQRRMSVVYSPRRILSAP